MNYELIASDSHTFAAYRAEPASTPRGGIVVIQEIFGVNAHIKRVVDSYAAEGYLAIAPAMFDRIERGVSLDYAPESVTKGRALKIQVSTEMMIRDVEAAIAAVAHAGKVGIVGYCWGGFVAWMAAAYAHGLSCAVPYYGGGMLEHADLTPRVPVLAHFGDRDTIIPVEGVRTFAANHPAHTVHIYAADHGFNCDERDSYDAAAAQLARDRTLAFFRQHVG
jgi:carboxymethylenebutenolidase